MFTGIVEACVPVRAFARRAAGARLVLPAPEACLAQAWGVARGESVAVCGCCLTVAETPAADGSIAFDLSAETLERTWLGALEPGRRVNLERALRLGDRLGGHMVSGHVDGGATLVASEDVGDGGRELLFEIDAGLERWLVDKGSVTLDGVSLTVVEPRGRRFRVAAIAQTLEWTNLGDARPGQRLNVEADLVAKWIERLMPRAPG